MDAVSIKSYVYHRAGLALEGYDPVAYHTEGKAIQGSEAFQTTWNGLRWRFTSEKHLQLFNENPEKYAPMYGGYCAFGVSNGYLAKPKLSAFTIVDDKLYLNFSEYVKKRWLEKRDNRIAEADGNWAAVKTTKPITANRHLVYLKYRFLLFFGKDTLA